MIADIADALHYTKQNKRFVYLSCGEILISVRKKDRHVYIEHYHGVEDDKSLSICHLGIAIKFLQRIEYLYNQHVTK